MKNIMKLLCVLLGIGGIAILFFNLGVASIVGFVLLIVAAIVALGIAFLEGNRGRDIGSYRNPRV